MRLSVYTKLRNGFLLSAVILLLLTASAKLYSILGTSRILDRADELLLMSNRTVLFAAGLVEMAVTATLLFGRSERVRLLSLLWLSSMFLLYRAAKWYYGISGPCTCLGSLTERLPFKAETTELGLQLVVFYLFVGSSLLLFSKWLGLRRGAGAFRRTESDLRPPNEVVPERALRE